MTFLKTRRTTDTQNGLESDNMVPKCCLLSATKSLVCVCTHAQCLDSDFECLGLDSKKLILEAVN
jgi:hypothetical protein